VAVIAVSGFNLPTTTQRCSLETEEFILEDLLSSVLSRFKKYPPSENLKFYYLGIFQSFKSHILMGKNPSNIFLAKFPSKYFGLLWVKG